MTVTDRVTAIQRELRSGDVLPQRACELLMTLTSLYGNCLNEVTRADMAYTAVLSGFLDTEKKANRAKIRAELSDEFRAKQAARNAERLVEEMIRSLKVVLKNQGTEMELAR